MLDIVITHYTEPWEVGEKLFRMIGLQRCVDFSRIHVTVVNDGGYRLPEDKLAALNYEVVQINIQHAGVSAARNAGLDHATGKWIMFCDFDDNFASIYSLLEIMRLLETDAYDMLWCKIIAEDFIDGKEMLYYVPDKQRFVFCHGKVYRTAFLREAGIRFDEQLNFNEDSCFNAVIIARTPHQRIGEIQSPVPLYAWIRREQSVTNSGREDEAAYGQTRRNRIVTAQYDGRRDDRYTGMVTRSAYDVYYMVHGKRISSRMKRKILDEFAPWLAERFDAYGHVTPEILDEIRAVSKNELLDPDENVQDEHERVRGWAARLAEIYNKRG